MARVFVGMSGGVDSSVAAALLVRQGHDVTGVTMQLLPEGDSPGQCCGTSAVRDARRVCDDLGIPHYLLNLRDAFAREVVTPFVEAYAHGRTPNPCVDCNARVKFGELLRRVLAQGADLLATGHYARIVTDSEGRLWLSRGADAAKDQSYFLYRLTETQMSRVLFPLGGMAKTQVRALAAEMSLYTADRPESQETCFLTAEGPSAFVRPVHPEAMTPGPILNIEGERIGTHRGIAAYTVGQRRGIGIAAPDPFYVIRIHARENAIVVGTAGDLAVTSVLCDDALWRGLPTGHSRVQLRSRAEAVEAEARFRDGALALTLREPAAGVAPGQAAVCYKDGIVIGGGTVREAS